MLTRQCGAQHTKAICDKCEDSVMLDDTPTSDATARGWTEIIVAPAVDNPTAVGQNYLLCDGCAGMLECFLGLSVNRIGASSRVTVMTSGAGGGGGGGAGATPVKSRGGAGGVGTPSQITVVPVGGAAATPVTGGPASLLWAKVKKP